MPCAAQPGRYFKDMMYIGAAVLLLSPLSDWAWLLWLLVCVTARMHEHMVRRSWALLASRRGICFCATGAAHRPSARHPPMHRIMGAAPEEVDAATQKRLDKKQRQTELFQRRAKP